MAEGNLELAQVRAANEVLEKRVEDVEDRLVKAEAAIEKCAKEKLAIATERDRYWSVLVRHGLDAP